MTTRTNWAGAWLGKRERKASTGKRENEERKRKGKSVGNSGERRRGKKKVGAKGRPKKKGEESAGKRVVESMARLGRGGVQRVGPLGSNLKWPRCPCEGEKKNLKQKDSEEKHHVGGKKQWDEAIKDI